MFNGWINMTEYKDFSKFTEMYEPSYGSAKIQLDQSNYATKANIKEAIVVDISTIASIKNEIPEALTLFLMGYF